MRLGDKDVGAGSDGCRSIFPPLLGHYVFPAPTNRLLLILSLYPTPYSHDCDKGLNLLPASWPTSHTAMYTVFKHYRLKVNVSIYMTQNLKNHIRD